MARSDNVMELPKDLPVPQDDGACDHLTGMTVPSVPLRSTRGRIVDLAKLKGATVGRIQSIIEGNLAADVREKLGGRGRARLSPKQIRTS